MIRKILLVLCIVAVSSSGFAQLKIPTEQLQGLLQSRKYVALFNESKKLREKEYGKCPIFDYFIGKSLCGVGKTDLAQVWYSNILKNYKGMTGAQKDLITNSKKSCASEAGGSAASASGNVLDMSVYVSALNAEGPSAGVRGKLGRVNTPCQTAPQPLKIIRTVSSEEMESRLFRIDQKDAAVAKYRALLNDQNYKVTTKGRFILITYESNSMDDEQAKIVSDKLETAYQFFISNYGLRPPDKLLAVYLLPELEGRNLLLETAEKVHGIAIPEVNIGYANIRDLSLLGFASSSRIGTLFHELMHLMIRTDIGDVPPWMDEGLASIYETAIISGDKLSGNLDNWRTAILEDKVQEDISEIPHLKDFLNYSWTKFDGIDDHDICRTAVNYAYAKHWILFLEQQDKLKTVFNALKNRAVLGNGGIVSLKTDEEIVESSLAGNIDEIESRFDAWMVSQYSFSLYRVDSSLQQETFLEAWTRDSKSANERLENLDSADAKRQGYEALVEKLAAIKSRYDQLNPTSNESAGEEQVMQEMNVMQQSIGPGNGLKDEHMAIAKREKKMEGIDQLKVELQDLEKEYESLTKD